jgi:hypothetical protein
MTALISLLSVVTLSILINKIATVALVQTGVAKHIARFQARSALTGCGFTTTEAEKVINHPVRRRIVAILMLLGNIPRRCNMNNTDIKNKKKWSRKSKSKSKPNNNPDPKFFARSPPSSPGPKGRPGFLPRSPRFPTRFLRNRWE